MCTVHTACTRSHHVVLSVELSTMYKIRMRNLCAQHDTVAHSSTVTLFYVCVSMQSMRGDSDPHIAVVWELLSLHALGGGDHYSLVMLILVIVVGV